MSLKKEKTPLCDAQRGFRSLNIQKYIVVGLGILIGPLFPKHLFAIFLFNHKVSGQECKDGILVKLCFFSDSGWPNRNNRKDGAHTSRLEAAPTSFFSLSRGVSINLCFKAWERHLAAIISILNQRLRN